MGTFLSFNEPHGVLLVQFHGVVTDEVLLERFEVVRAWFGSHGHHSSISDFSEVSSFEVTSKAVTQLAAHKPLVPDGFLRIVVAPQDEAFGMTRMFEALGSKTRNQVYVVRTHAEAYRLIGVESLEFQSVLEW